MAKLWKYLNHDKGGNKPARRRLQRLVRPHNGPLTSQCEICFVCGSKATRQASVDPPHTVTGLSVQSAGIQAGSPLGNCLVNALTNTRRFPPAMMPTYCR